MSINLVVETGRGRPAPADPPSDLKAMRQIILARRHDFSGQIEQVLRFSLERPEVVALGNQATLAAECGVAQATVLRAARAIGFHGFAAYRQVFRAWLTSERRSILLDAAPCTYFDAG